MSTSGKGKAGRRVDYRKASRRRAAEVVMRVRVRPGVKPSRFAYSSR